MSRLIDANTLIAEIKEYEKTLGKVGYNTNGSDFVINVIRNQPTVYDVEAVVRELEKCEFCPAIITGDYCDVENRDCTECFRGKAIEIVRGGRNDAL